MGFSTGFPCWFSAGWFPQPATFSTPITTANLTDEFNYSNRNTNGSSSMVRQPIHEIRRGLIKVRIWRKRTRDRLRHTITVTRLFRNGDLWKESTRFGRDDIPLLRIALDAAHTWIFQQTKVH